MDAVVVTRDDRTARVVDRPRPEPGPGEALVRTLRVGVDGTDHEVIRGDHGEFPPGDDHMVLGHEAVGVVADPNGTDLREGDVVVPTVRRPRRPPGGRSRSVRRPRGDPSRQFERGRPDMAGPGEYVERGIDGAHGFMAEYVTSPASHLVRIPEGLAARGFLVEPVSISEKAFELAFAARSSFDWQPETALVLGNGSLGLLTLAMLHAADRFKRLYCLGRRDRPDPSIDVVESLDATYVDSREAPVDEVADVLEPVDLVYEATGYAPHAFETVSALAPNGVGALLGVPTDRRFEVDGGRLHRELVLENKALVGSVNSSVGHFEAAVDALAGMSESFLADLVTGVHGLDDLDAAFATDDRTIKTAVQFSSP
jgi:threonine dehydrogenase-like Zn-dependent dehydrogenase